MNVYNGTCKTVLAEISTVPSKVTFGSVNDTATRAWCETIR